MHKAMGSIHSIERNKTKPKSQTTTATLSFLERKMLAKKGNYFSSPHFLLPHGCKACTAFLLL